MFYTFSQNNSGGDFDIDDKVAEWVIIEADSADEANDIAEGVGIYFDGCENGYDCDCCGDRWYRQYDYEGTETPEIYGRPVVGEGHFGYLRRNAIIYYKNGVVETVKGSKDS